MTIRDPISGGERGGGPTPDGELERWTIDPACSRLRFSLQHLIILQIRGGFGRWGGTLFFDRREPALSSVQVWVELGSIETGEPERDEHIRSAEFLEVARFPRASFESDSVAIRDQRGTVRGRLDLHGAVRDVELRVETRQESRAPSGQPRRRYKVSGSLDRQAFGLHWNQDLDVGGVVVGDRIELAADVELVRVEDDPVGPPQPVQG